MNIITALAAIVALVVGGMALTGWLLMLLFGVVGAVFGWASATKVGFLDATAIGVLFGLIKGLYTFKPPSKE